MFLEFNITIAYSVRNTFLNYGNQLAYEVGDICLAREVEGVLFTKASISQRCLARPLSKFIPPGICL